MVKKKTKTKINTVYNKGIIAVQKHNYKNHIATSELKFPQDKKPDVYGYSTNPNKGSVKFGFSGGFSDYNEFPAITYFNDVYGLFPSQTHITYTFNLELFLKCLLKIKKDYVYTKNLHATGFIEGNTKDANNKLSYIFFNNKKLKICFYISIEETYINDIWIRDEYEKQGASTFSIYCLYNGQQYNSNDIISIVDSLFNLPKIIIKSPEKNSIAFISQDKDGLKTVLVEIKKPEIDFDVNYDKGFQKKHEFLLSELNKDKSGIVFLYGVSGGGKTMYLRYLINELKDKKVLYMPSNMVQLLSSPGFLTFMIEQKNSILVIEDAENCVKNTGERDIAVTNLLNLADGMMSDALNIKIIATFNTEIKNIDQALLREGRMILKHEFKALPAEQATVLSKKLGINKIYTEDRTLAQIYNEEKEYKEEIGVKSKVGFKV